MIENIDETLKIQIINNRLQNLARQYFETKLDIIQAEVNERHGDFERHTEFMLQLKRSYDAIKELLEK